MILQTPTCSQREKACGLKRAWAEDVVYDKVIEEVLQIKGTPAQKISIKSYAIVLE
jgi:hypothetical protein